MGKYMCPVADKECLLYLSYFVFTYEMSEWMMKAFLLTENAPNKNVFNKYIFACRCTYKYETIGFDQ